MTDPTTWRLPARFLGLALAAGAAAPAAGGPLSSVGVVLVIGAAAFGWWAAPPVNARLERTEQHPLARLNRHRNTVLATGAVLLAALGSPSLWVAAGITALLLGYLLLLDSESRGRRRPGPLPAAAACAAAALVLLAAFAPTTSSDWARLPAVLGVAVAALAVAAALWARRG